MSLRVTQIPTEFALPNGEACKEWDTFGDHKIAGVIHAMMFVGMSEISNNSFQEFAQRFMLWEHSFGPIFLGSTDDYRLSRDIGYLRRFIGLRVNVTYITPAGFKKLIWQGLIKQMDEEYERLLKCIPHTSCGNTRSIVCRHDIKCEFHRDLKPTLELLAHWFNPDYPEYIRQLDNGMFLYVEKAGGGTLGKAYSGEWWYVILDDKENVIRCSQDVQTGMPKSHTEVADIIIDYLEESDPL